MSSEARTIWTHGRTYLIGNFLSRLSGLLLIPVYAKFLSTEEFGVYALILVAMDFLSAILGMGISSALPRVFVEHEDPATRNRVLSSTLLAFCAIGGAVLLLSWPVALGIDQLLFSHTEEAGVLTLALCTWVFILLFEIELDCYRVRKRSGMFLVLSLIKSVLVLAFSVLFIVVLDYGVAGIFLGQLVTFLPLSLGVLFVILRETGSGFSLPLVRSVLGLGMPLVPSGMFFLASRVAERYFLNRFLSSAAVAYFSLGWTLVQFIVILAVQPFSQIFVLRRFETANDDRAHVQLSEVLVYFFLLILAMGLGLSLFAPEILLVIATPAYLPAAEVMPLLALAICVQSISYVHYEVKVIGAKRTEAMALVNGVSLVVSIVAGFVLIRWIGLIGAAIAALITNVARVALVAVMARRLSDDRLRLETGRIAAAFGLAIGVYAVSAAVVGYEVDLARTALRIVLFAAFALAAFFSPIVGPTGRDMALKLARGLRDRRLRPAHDPLQPLARVRVGMDDVWRAMRSARVASRMEGQRQAAFATSPEAFQASGNPASEWTVAKEGANELTLRQTKGTIPGVARGDVVAVQSAEGEAARVCLVSWVTSDNPEQIEVGLQVLAQRASSAVGQMDAHPKARRLPVLYFPRLPERSELPAILVPAGGIDGASHLFLRKKSGLARMILVRVLERTDRVELIEVTPERRRRPAA